MMSFWSRLICLVAVLCGPATVLSSILPAVGYGTAPGEWTSNVDGVRAVSSATGYPILIVVVRESDADAGCAHCMNFLSMHRDDIGYLARRYPFYMVLLNAMAGAQGYSTQAGAYCKFFGTSDVLPSVYLMNAEGEVYKGWGYPVTESRTFITQLQAYAASIKSLKPNGWQQARTLMVPVVEGGAPTGILQLKVGKKNGRNNLAKVSGSFVGLDLRKRTIKASVASVSDGTATYTLWAKGSTVPLQLTVTTSGAYGMWGSAQIEDGRVGGALAKSSMVLRVPDFSLGLPGEVPSLLPRSGEAFSYDGLRWRFPSATKVSYGKSKGATGPSLNIDMENGRKNRSAMKVSYNGKKGTFKGSFRDYALVPGAKGVKLVKNTVKFTGVVVDGKGFGQATCRKQPAKGPWPVFAD